MAQVDTIVCHTDKGILSMAADEVFDGVIYDESALDCKIENGNIISSHTVLGR